VKGQEGKRRKGQSERGTLVEERKRRKREGRERERDREGGREGEKKRGGCVYVWPGKVFSLRERESERARKREREERGELR